MAQNAHPDTARLGFLTAVQTDDAAFVGGLLVTNHYGRPLEFQCTTPVRANRTQEILYGPTLEPFLLGELIGRTLVEKVGVKPDLLLVEREDLLALREHIATPTACLEIPAEDEQSSVDRPQTWKIGRSRFLVNPEYAKDVEAVERAATAVPADADLSEPFERVREALREAVGIKAAA